MPVSSRVSPAVFPCGGSNWRLPYRRGEPGCGALCTNHWRLSYQFPRFAAAHYRLRLSAPVPGAMPGIQSRSRDLRKQVGGYILTDEEGVEAQSLNADQPVTLD